MKRERGTFRSLAREARGRLAGNFWREVRVEKARLDGKTVLNQFMTCVRSKVTRELECDPAEEQLYTRVREILCSGANPLAAVLDREYMRGLGDCERERYVFTLSEKVKACIERFEQEKAFENVVGV